MAEQKLRVSVVYSPGERRVEARELLLENGATLGQALLASGLLAAYPEIDTVRTQLGVWGRKAALGQILQDRDRVEIYRPLRVDPRVARRERFRKQGARSTGLFAARRDGAGPGD